MNIEWSNRLDIGNIMSLLGFLAASVRLFFSGNQIKRTRRVDRAKFILDVTARYFNDAEARKFYYQLDYDFWKFDLDKFPLSDEERWLDSMIYTFDLIGRMIRINVLSIDDVSILAFQ